MDGSNQEEKTHISTLDVFNEDPYVFSEHNIGLTTLTVPQIPPDIAVLSVF